MFAVWSYILKQPSTVGPEHAVQSLTGLNGLHIYQIVRANCSSGAIIDFNRLLFVLYYHWVSAATQINLAPHGRVLEIVI